MKDEARAPPPRNPERRRFLKTLAAGAVVAGALPARAETPAKTLQVWPSGGLAEAMPPAHDAPPPPRGVATAYTGPFARAPRR